MTAASLPQATAALVAARQAPGSAEAACPEPTARDPGPEDVGRSRDRCAREERGRRRRSHFVVPVQAWRHGRQAGAAVTGGRWHISDAGVGRDRWRRLGRIARPRTSRRELRIGVDDVFRLGRGPQVGVDRQRQVVEVEQSQRGPEVLLAELRRLGCSGVGDAPDHAAHEPHRVGEVDERERPGHTAGRRVVDVLVVGDRVRRHVQDVLQRQPIVNEVLSDGGQASDLLGGLFAAACDEALHLADRDREVRQRRVQVGPAVVHHAGQTGQPVLEHDDLLLAVAQRADEDLQVLDDVDDVAAAFGKNPCDTGQFGQRRPKLVAVAVQRVGRAVDEPADGGVRDCAFRAGFGAQFGCQAHQLGLDLIPLHWYCGSVAGDHRAVTHLRSVALPVCRRELHIARRDQVLRDDHGFGTGRHRIRRGRP